jgi:hypothetical protein
MAMDLMAATAYLLTFRFKAFKAVLQAHKEYRKMRQQISAESISAYLKVNHDTEVRHIYGRWIVLQSLLHGRSIFSGIHETDFFKF